MALRINTNIPAVHAMVDLSRHTRQLVRTFGRISSGLRINESRDDPAGMAVAENLATEGKSIAQATRNTNDGISIMSASEGASTEVAELLRRMRELALASSSSTMSNTDRVNVHNDAQEMFEEIKRISSSTKFNGIQLTDGTATNLDVQVGTDGLSHSQLNIKLGDLTTTGLSITTSNIDISTTTNASAAVSILDNALSTVNGYRASFGSSSNRLNSALQGLQSSASTVAIAEGNIRDADFAYETAQMTKLQIMQQASIAVLAQANSLGSAALGLL